MGVRLSLYFIGTPNELVVWRPLADAFMSSSLPGLRYGVFSPVPRCRLAGCRVPQPNLRASHRVVQARMPTAGMHALSVLFDRFGCTSVRLYGFGEPPRHTRTTYGGRGLGVRRASYHYWGDGSTHDGKDAAAFYSAKLREFRFAHDFAAEHWFLFDVLGNGSWIVEAASYTRQCVHPKMAPRCEEIIEDGDRKLSMPDAKHLYIHSFLLGVLA